MIILTIKYVDVCNAGPKAVGDIINILKKKYKDKIEEKTIEVHQNYYDNNGFKSVIRKIINHMKRIIALIELNTKKESASENVICTPKVRHFWRCIFL